MTTKVLNIDDSKKVHWVIAKALKPFGIEIITAQDFVAMNFVSKPVTTESLLDGLNGLIKLEAA